MKIAYFASGKLGFNTLLKVSFEPLIIFTDKKSEEIIQYAQNNSIPVYVGNPRTVNGVNVLKKFEIDFILSVNYLFLITEEVIKHPKRGAINLHGSLLPKYRGRTPHVWAIINDETMTGITAHFIDEGCDTGDIIEQIEIPIENTDTGQMILNKFELIYPKLVDSILFKINTGRYSRKKQNELESSFYGKRDPNDGLINWQWPTRKIYNWVRAQAKPYPGAFSYYEGEKVIIDWVTEEFYSGNQSPGSILTLSPVKIKTKDGAVALDSIRNNNIQFKLKTGFSNDKI